MKQDGITRGPWTIEGPDQFGDFNIHHPADRLAIGAVVSNLRPSEEVAANAHFIVAACNAYEPMREVLANLSDKTAHLVDAIEIAPSATNYCKARVLAARCAVASARAALSTLPVNERHTSDDVGILRDALADLCDEIDRHIDAALDDRKPVFKGIVAARAALKGVPQPATRHPEQIGWLVEMNDAGPKYYSFSENDPDDPWGGFQREAGNATRFARKEDAEAIIAAFAWTPGHVFASEHVWGGEKIEQPASDDYQADAGAPALSEKVNLAEARLLENGSITIRYNEREDGGCRIWSDDLPGLILSHKDSCVVWQALGAAMQGLLFDRQVLSRPSDGNREDWQPEGSMNLIALLDAIQRLEKELPGWWWSVGACHVSSDASVGPPPRAWTHAHIGPDMVGPSAHLLGYRKFAEDFDGFSCDLSQPATCAQALNGAIDMALSSLEQMGDKSAYGPIVMKGPGLDAWNSAKDKS